MHVSKAFYINIYQTIDEPFWFNANLRHTLVTLVLIVNTFSASYFSLIPILFFTSHSFLHFKLVFGYDPDNKGHKNMNFYHILLNIPFVFVAV